MRRILDLLLTLRGVFTYYLKSKNFPFKTAKSQREYQFLKLKKILIIAAENVPYYKGLFKDIKFNPLKDFNSLDDLNKIPILDKKLVRDNPNLFYNEKCHDYLTLHTSGSSGNPLEVRVSKNAWVIEQAVVWRHWQWAGYRFRDKMAIVRSYVPKNGKLIKVDKIRNFIYYSPFHINDENAKMYLKHMSDEKIKFIRGYPSSIKALADQILNNEIKPPKIKGILVASERLSLPHKEIIERAFNAKVYNHYGLADLCVMMGSCERDMGLHNYEDYGYLELLGHENLQQGAKKIVGTNLHNLAMPLIRYDTNDLAEISNTACTCERNFPIIQNILGRNDALIQTKEGYSIPTVNFYTLFEYYTEIEQWQMIQRSLELIEINIQVKGAGDNYSTKKITEDLNHRLPSSLVTRININKGFTMKNEGKIPTFINEL